MKKIELSDMFSVRRGALCLVLLVLMLATLCSCLPKAGENNSDKVYKADVFAYVSTHKGDDDFECSSTLQNTDRYTIGIHIPVTGNDNADYFLSSLALTCANDFKDSMASAEVSDESGKGVLFGDYTVFEDAKFVSLLIEFDIRLPEEEPVKEYYSLLYNKDDSSVLTLGDITGSTYLSPVAELVIASLKADAASVEFEELMSDKYFSELSLMPASYAAFTIDGETDEVTLYFNPNTILEEYDSAIILKYALSDFKACITDEMYINLFNDAEN